MTSYTIYVDLPGDLSPKEVAEKVRSALTDAGAEPAKVQYSDIDSILWINKQEKIEGIVYKGSGYGAPRHLAILERAHGTKVAS